MHVWFYMGDSTVLINFYQIEGYYIKNCLRDMPIYLLNAQFIYIYICILMIFFHYGIYTFMCI
jgi:hypothetical protein